MKTVKQPLVSVIMPVYNAGEFVAEAIESILNQTYGRIELVIVDDMSTDSSWKIITSYAKRYPTIIRAYRLTTTLNHGGDSCANEAFKHTRGTYIARMDADDRAHPNRLQKQVQFLEEHPEVIVLGSQAKVINRKGKTTGHKRVPTTHEDIYNGYFIFNPIIHPTMMIRKSLIPKNRNLYKIRYSANNDLCTFFDFLNIGKFANLSEELLDYRVHMHNDSLTKPKERFMNTLKIRFRAVLEGYKPTPNGLLVTIAQALVIGILPERFIVPLYLYIKGIRKISFKNKLRFFKHTAAAKHVYAAR